MQFTVQAARLPVLANTCLLAGSEQKYYTTMKLGSTQGCAEIHTLTGARLGQISDNLNVHTHTQAFNHGLPHRPALIQI